MQTRHSRAKAIAVTGDARGIVWVGLLTSALVLLSAGAAWLPAT